MLGALDKKDLKVPEDKKDEIPKAILNEEQDIEYGKIFISSTEIDLL
jgi:hypothetical protein